MRKFFIAAAVAVISLIASGSTAQAGFVVTVHETGFTDQTFNFTSGGINNDTGSVTIGQYSVNISGFDSAPGISTLFGGALVSQNTFTITTTSAATAPLVVTVQDDTFNSGPYAPGTAATVRNSLSTTAISPFGTVTANGFMIGGSTLTTPDISLNGGTDGNLGDKVANSISGPVAPLGLTFTLGNVSTVDFSGNGGIGAANFTVTTLAPVPAPAGLVLALTGLPMLGIGGWIRRCRQTA